MRNGNCAFIVMEINFPKTDTENRLLWLLLLLLLCPIAAFVAWKCKGHKKISIPESPCLRIKREHGCISIDSDTYDFSKVLTKVRYIGKGLDGEIYGPLQYKGKQCAVERIRGYSDQEEIIWSNGQQWMALNHDNLIRFYAVVHQYRAVYIVMEYAAGGSVRKALNRCANDLPPTVVKDWAMQIAEGMKYLHVNDIIHGSLKCAHVMVMDQEPNILENTTLKISCKRINDDDDDYTGAGSRKEQDAFLPPEVFQGKAYSKAADIWSYGVTVWEILTRKIPYENVKNVLAILNGILTGRLSLEIPDSCPPVIRGIFEECFDRVPENRPEFSEILTKLNEMQVMFPGFEYIR